MSHNMNEAIQTTASVKSQSEFAIEVKDLVKAFPGTLAINGINVQFKRGSVIGLLGKNGSGKSTLVNILSGLLPKTSGEVFYDGREVHIKTVRDSEDLGFRFISQEPYLMDDLSVAENIAFREKHLKKGMALVRQSDFIEEARKKLSVIDLNIDPTLQTKFLKVSEKQMILAVREVLSSGAKVIAFDEVSNALSTKEVEHMFDLIRKEKKKGKTFIYISHEIDEVFKICDSVCVMRDGEVVLEGETKDLTSARLKSAIAGKNIDESAEITHVTQNEEVALKVRALTNVKLKNIDFDLHKGEVLGVYGLRGSGRTELLKTIFGLMPALAGEATYKGKNILKLSPTKRGEMGIGFVPEDRSEGVMDCRPIRDNLFLSASRKFVTRLGLIDYRSENERYMQVKEEFQVKAESIEDEIAYLSGGNKQKIMLARGRAQKNDLYLIDEGTRGIDIGTKYEIYALIDRLAQEGSTFLYTSSDLDEITMIAHRIIILHEGRIVAEIGRSEFSKELLLHYADGNIKENSKS